MDTLCWVDFRWCQKWKAPQDRKFRLKFHQGSSKNSQALPRRVESLGNVDSSELSTRHSVGQPSFLWPQVAAVSRAADGRRDPEAGRALFWKASSSWSVQNPVMWPCPIASEVGVLSPLWLALSQQNVYYWGRLWSHSHRCPFWQPEPSAQGPERNKGQPISPFSGRSIQNLGWPIHSVTRRALVGRKERTP